MPAAHRVGDVSALEPLLLLRFGDASPVCGFGRINSFQPDEQLPGHEEGRYVRRRVVHQALEQIKTAVVGGFLVQFHGEHVTQHLVVRRCFEQRFELLSPCDGCHDMAYRRRQESIGVQTDAQSGTVKVKLVIENPSNDIRAGEICTLNI